MKKDKMFAFLCGDFISMSFFLLYSSGWTLFFAKLFSTMAIGVIGGMAGLAGKDFYAWLKSLASKKPPIQK